MSGRFVVLFAFAVATAAVTGASIIEPRDRAGLATVIDGDELIVDGTHIRLQYIDAFELGQLCRAAAGVIFCGREAKKALEAMIAGGVVFCMAESGRDQPQRPNIAACSLPWPDDIDSSPETIPDSLDMSEAMIREGWALVRPDKAKDMAGTLCGLEAEAKRLRKGAWAFEFVLPATQRGERLRGNERISCGNEPQVGP